MTRRSAIATLVAALALIVALATTSSLRTSTPSSGTGHTEPAGLAPPSRPKRATAAPRRRPSRPRRRRNASRRPSRPGRPGTFRVQTGALALGSGARLGGRARPERRGRRLGAGDRRRPERAVRLRARDPVRGQTVRRQLPDAVDGAGDLQGRRRNLGQAAAAVRVQGIGAVRPDHRGRARHRRRLRPLHERVQRRCSSDPRTTARPGPTPSPPTARSAGTTSRCWRSATTVATCTPAGTAPRAATRGSPNPTTPARPGPRHAWRAPSSYFYAYDADVTSSGRVVFAEGAVTYGSSTGLDGSTEVHAFVSDDRGTTWRDVVVDSFPPSIACADCRADYYAGHVASRRRRARRVHYRLRRADDRPRAAADLRASLDSTAATGAPARPSRSTAEHATAPMLESIGNGDVRLVYYQTAGGGEPRPVERVVPFLRRRRRRRGPRP